MSQSRFSIVLVGVSALLRRPFVSRLRPAVFSARGSGGFRRSVSPSVSALAAGRVGLRAHGFRFSARTASGLPLGGLAFGLTAFAFRHAPIRSCRWASSFFRLPLWKLPLGGWPSGSLLPLFGMRRFGDCPRRVGSAAFRFGVCRSAGWPLGSRLPLFGMRRFGDCPRRVGSSAFRFGVCHSAGWCFRLPLRSCPRRVGLRAHCFRFSARPASEITARRVGLRAHGFRFSACTASGLPSASWPSGSRLLLFGMRRSAPPYRRSEGRRNTPTRHLFHFKTLIPTC